MRNIIGLAVCLIFAGCAAPTTNAPVPPTSHVIKVHVNGPKAIHSERTACNRVGGTISRQGLLGHEMCVIPYPDAGKVCTDSSQCQGQCRADSSLDTEEAMNATSGTCQINTIPFGCYATIENGKGTATLCVD